MTEAESLETLRLEIVDLQTKIQFQEDTIQQLDRVVVGQEERMTTFVRRLELLEEGATEISNSNDTNKTVEQEKPPHY